MCCQDLVWVIQRIISCDLLAVFSSGRLPCCYTTAVQTCWLVAARKNFALWYSCECQRAAILHVLQDLPAGLAQLPRLAFIGSHYCVSFVFVNDLKVLAEREYWNKLCWSNAAWKKLYQNGFYIINGCLPRQNRLPGYFGCFLRQRLCRQTQEMPTSTPAACAFWIATSSFKRNTPILVSVKNIGCSPSPSVEWKAFHPAGFPSTFSRALSSPAGSCDFF